MRTVAGELLATLERAGVRHIFGVPGTTETPLLDALVDAPGIEYVLCLHEAVAVAMADGYARASGMPAVANVHTSVGTANSLSMLHVCWQDSSPVLVLAGHKDSRILGTAAYCEEPQDIVQMPAQFTRWSWSPRRAEQVIPAVERALKETVASPPRPSFLAISEDLLAALREPAR